MSANLISVTARDANGTPVPAFSVKVFDTGSMSSVPVTSAQTEPSGETYWCFDIGDFSPVDVVVDHPQYFQRKVRVRRDKATDTFS